MIDEALICTCGTEMVSIRPDSDIKKCPNCDAVQTVEQLDWSPTRSNAREKTDLDAIYEERWEERKKVIYA